MCLQKWVCIENTLGKFCLILEKDAIERSKLNTRDRTRISFTYVKT